VRRALPLLLGVALVLPACSTDDDPVVTVNGEEILQTDEFEAQLAEIADDDTFLTALDARGTGTDTLDAGFVASVLSNHVLDAILVEALEERGVEVTQADIDEGRDQLATTLEQSYQLSLEAVPESYREALLDLFADAIALRRDAGTDTLEDLVPELYDEAEVDIADRYGRWDREQRQVVPPDAPATPTTEPLAPSVPEG
jgi:hypothetical protein